MPLIVRIYTNKLSKNLYYYEKEVQELIVLGKHRRHLEFGIIAKNVKAVLVMIT